MRLIDILLASGWVVVGADYASTTLEKDGLIAVIRHFGINDGMYCIKERILNETGITEKAV